MRLSSSSRTRRTTLHAAIVLLILLMASLSSFGQGQTSPLSRGSGSDIEGRAPTDFLGATVAFIDGNDALAMRLRYICVTSTGASDNNCQVGRTDSPLPTATRLVDVYWAMNGTTPIQNAVNTSTLATAPNTITNQNSNVFLGNIPKTALDKLAEGGTIRWIHKVRLTNADLCTDTVCDRFDPADTTGQVAYAARVDRSTPTIVVNQIPGAFVENTTKDQWFIYTPSTFNPPKPIVISVVDDAAGAPIDQARTSIYFNGNTEAHNGTAQFTRTQITPTSVTYTWNPSDPSTGSIQFQTSADSFLHVDTRDTVGHRLDTRNTPNTPAVRVVIDTRRPTLDNETSNLKLGLGQSGLASKGEHLRIGINATDFGTPAPDNFQTPKELMRVCATLVPATDRPYENLTAAQRDAEAAKCVDAPFASTSTAANVTTGGYLRIPYNATRTYHYTDRFVVPNDWNVNGLVTARIVVVDPVGHAVVGNTWQEYGPNNNKRSSNLTVDLLDPVIVQKEPLTGTDTTDFVSTDQVRFRVRVTDPGDTDPWQGVDTEKNDKDLLGIDQETVKVHYRIDDGNQVAVTLKAIAEENHFASNPLTLAEEDTLKYFFEAKDLSGNPARLPATGDYTIRVDRKGPVIEEARSHEFLNGATHTFRFNVTDTGIGIDTSQATLFWRTPGTQFKTVPLAATDGVFTASVPGQPDGTTIEWYAEASDLFGNRATLPLSNAATRPIKATIDLVAPTTTVTSPDRVTSPRFNVTWSAVDDRGNGTGSGADTFTIEFRVGEGGRWFTLVRDTESRSFEVCADAQKTYYFRGSATDRAGNVEAFPTNPQTQTFVDAAEACADPPQVSISAPLPGSTVSGDYTVRWTASSQVAPDGLSYTVELAQAGAAARTLASIEDPEANNFVWKTASMDPADPCFEAGTYDLRVIARDPNEKVGVAESAGIVLQNGIADCDDRDGDGLLDSWEVAQFGDLAQGPNDDPDADGHSNLSEYLGGSDPNEARSVPSDPDGDKDDDTGWSNLYLLVVLAFLATLVVFVVGVSRRW